MAITEFEHGKTRIMTQTREELRRAGLEYHCVLFDIHPSTPHPNGATLTVAADGNCVRGWFRADEIEDSQHRVGRPDVRRKIVDLVARVRQSIAA